MTQEQRELLKSLDPEIWSMALMRGLCEQHVLHCALDATGTALCGATLQRGLGWMLLPGVRVADDNVCPECAAKVDQIAEAATAALAVDDAPTAGTVAAPGHEEALAELVAEVERLHVALRLACEELAEGCCPKHDDAYCGEATEEFCNEGCGDQRYPDCLVQKYLAEAAKAGEGE